MGIIGRTGAGKSSLVQALYRTVDLAEGQIQVDGVDLAGLGLETVSLFLVVVIQRLNISLITYSFAVDLLSSRRNLSCLPVLFGKSDSCRSLLES